MCFESKLIEKVLKKVKKAIFAAADLKVQRLMMLLKLFTISTYYSRSSRKDFEGQCSFAIDV